MISRKALVPAAFVACLLPLAWLGGRYLRNDLGANPISELENRLGFYALLMLLLSLACTPAQVVFKWKWPLLLRKLFGDYAFFYACLHLSTYVGVDQFFDWGEIGKDLVKRKFITVGMATWVLLLPLAVTSTQGWQKRLGFRRWKRLHRLTYVAGVGALVHFTWRFKTLNAETASYAAILLLLFAVRIVHWARSRRPRAQVNPAV
jgi:sulfoxide reductase heme-binding subunit YedZ